MYSLHPHQWLPAQQGQARRGKPPPSSSQEQPPPHCPSAACLFLALALPFLVLPIAPLVLALARRAWVRLAHDGELHPLLASGRLGNTLFQHLAVSLLAEKYDLRASYAIEAECAQLGIPLWREGRGLMTGPEVGLTDELLRALLTAPAGARLEGTLVVEGFYQFPWFAAHLRDSVFRGPLEELISRANPWRLREGACNDTFVHVRLGDMARKGARGAEAYIAAVGEPVGRVFVASDSPGHDTVAAILARFGGTLVELSPVRTIQFGAACGFLVLSDGTFSWAVGVLAGRGARVRVVARDLNWGGDIIFEDWARF